MIVKSMSRKVPSFGQLIGYIDRDEGQEPYRIRHNLMGRDPDRIREEFERNGDLLQRRKNGVYLYHEIISMTRAQGLSVEEQKSRLYEITQSYIAARCPNNLVFGGLHQDKEHSFHYHLMISANRAGERGRLRLTKSHFRQIQVGLENHVLAHFPELEQKVAIGKRSDRKLSRSEAELERRTGHRPKREEVLERLREAFALSRDRDSLLEALGRADLELYIRGKNLGVIDHESGKRHRLKTLDAEFADRIEGRMMKITEPEEKMAREGEKEKGAEERSRRDDERHQSQQQDKTSREQDARQRKEDKTSQKEAKAGPGSRRREEPEQELSDVQKAWKEQMRERRERQRELERDRDRGDLGRGR